MSPLPLVAFAASTAAARPGPVARSVRLADWPERLNDLILQRMRAPFAWGRNDCALFVADALLAQTGCDLASHLRGQYHSESEAAQIIASEGGLHALMCTVLGAPLAHPQQAGRGDVVLVPHQGADTLGICTGPEWACPGQRGLVFRPIAEATRAWTF
jgi:hypothetical protein